MSPDERQPAPALSSDDLARERTLMALDRTQMAWIRTGLSMLTFGFSLLKFFQFLRGQDAPRALAVHGPRRLGLAIMALGFVALSMATWQYVHDRRRLRGAPLRQSPAFLVALFLLGLQGLALVLSFMGL
jgi:putative membrane protein